MAILAPFQAAYKAWVRFLLNRNNTVNKRQYKNDPTILAFDLMNEPSTEPGFDSNVRKLAPGTTIKAWVEEMLFFVKQELKPKQLIFVGDVRVEIVSVRSVYLLDTDWRSSRRAARASSELRGHRTQRRRCQGVCL